MNKLYGNALVGQSGGPTAAINATLAGVIRGALAAKTEGTIGHLYGMKNGILGFLEEKTVDLFQVCGTEERLRLLENTPAAALGSCRKKLPDPEKDDEGIFPHLLTLFQKYDIRYFFYIGGNDSMDTVAKLSYYTKKAGYEMRVIGVPKTIDNDLCGTDHTPGFGSAAKYVATTVSEIVRDCAVYVVPAVTIVEIMGRDAGWLTASAALARMNGEGPDLIYLPERDFSNERFLSDVRYALARHPNVVVAVSEGIRYSDGTYVGASAQSGAVDIFGHRYLSGTARALEQLVKAEIGCKVRAVELNLPQRCASHLASKTDLRESVGVGRAAVNAAVAGKTGKMMVILRREGERYHVSYRGYDVKKIANRVRSVPDAYITEDGAGITDAGILYLLPLIQGEARILYKNGLPVHIDL